MKLDFNDMDYIGMKVKVYTKIKFINLQVGINMDIDSQIEEIIAMDV